MVQIESKLMEFQQFLPTPPQKKKNFFAFLVKSMLEKQILLTLYESLWCLSLPFIISPYL